MKMKSWVSVYIGLFLFALVSTAVIFSGTRYSISTVPSTRTPSSEPFNELFNNFSMRLDSSRSRIPDEVMAEDLFQILLAYRRENGGSLGDARKNVYPLLPSTVRIQMDQNTEFVGSMVKAMVAEDDSVGLGKIFSGPSFWEATATNPSVGESLFVKFSGDPQLVGKMVAHGFALGRIKQKSLSGLSASLLENYPELQSQVGVSMEDKGTGLSSASIKKSVPPIEEMSPCLKVLLVDSFQSDIFCSFVFESLNSDLPEAESKNTPQYSIQKHMNTCVVNVAATVFEKRIVNHHKERTHTLPMSEVSILDLGGVSGGHRPQELKYPLATFFKSAELYCSEKFVQRVKTNRNGDTSIHFFSFGQEHHSPSFLIENSQGQSAR